MMKQAVELGVAPRAAYEEAILIGSASDFWGYQEISQRLYSTRRKQGIPKEPENKVYFLSKIVIFHLQ